MAYRKMCRRRGVLPGHLQCHSTPSAAACAPRGSSTCRGGASARRRCACGASSSTCCRCGRRGLRA
eukprot:144868-Alexandrium_andersonii.AAC.1